jgi:hypothetical protein
VRVDPGGVFTATSTTIEESSTAVANSGSATLTGCTLRTNTSGVQATAGTMNVGTSLLTGNTYGLGGALTVVHSTLVSNSYGAYSASASGSVTVNNSIITNNGSYGLCRSSGAVAITNSPARSSRRRATASAPRSCRTGAAGTSRGRRGVDARRRTR